MGMCCDRAAAVSDRAAARRGSERRPQNRREACYPCRNVHGLLLSVVAPRRTSVAGVVGDGVDERRTPPAVGCRTRKTERGERRRSSPQGHSWGNRLPGGCYEGSVRPARRSQEDAGEEDAARPGCIAFRLGESYEGSDRPTTSTQASAWEKTQLGPGASNVSGRAARREAASLLSTADRRMVRRLPCNIRCKPAHVEGAA